MLKFDELIRTLFVEIDKYNFYLKLKIELIKTHDNQFYTRVFEENLYELTPTFDESFFASNHRSDELLFIPIDYYFDKDKYDDEQECLEKTLQKIEQIFN